MIQKPNSQYPEAISSLLVREIIDHPLVVLTLKVIYSVSFIVDNRNKQSDFVVCYAHLMPEIDASLKIKENQPISKLMNTGPSFIGKQ